MEPKIITETERLQITTVESHDSTFILQLLNSPSWLEFIGDKGVRTEEVAKTYIETSITQSYQKHGFGLYKVILKDSSIPVGLCGFLKRDYLDHPDMGFALLPKFEGLGLMHEACLTLLGYASSELRMGHILAIVMPSNTRSCTLLEKLGFHEAGKVSPNKEAEQLLLYSNKKSHSN